MQADAVHMETQQKEKQTYYVLRYRSRKDASYILITNTL